MTTVTSLGGGDSFPLHQILHLAIEGDPSGQDFILFTTGQAPRCSEIAADGALEVGELAVGVHAVNYVCWVKPWEAAQHLCCCGVWVCVAERGDLRVRGLQGTPWPPTFPLQRWRGNRHDAGRRACLDGATEAGGCLTGKEEVKKMILVLREVTKTKSAETVKCK